MSKKIKTFFAPALTPAEAKTQINQLAKQTILNDIEVKQLIKKYASDFAKREPGSAKCMEIVAVGFVQATHEELDYRSHEYLSDDALKVQLKSAMRKVMTDPKLPNEEKVKGLLGIGIETGLAYADQKSKIDLSRS